MRTLTCSSSDQRSQSGQKVMPGNGVIRTTQITGTRLEPNQELELKAKATHLHFVAAQGPQNHGVAEKQTHDCRPRRHERVVQLLIKGARDRLVKEKVVVPCVF